VVIPRENEKDIKEIPARILKVVELVPVDHMDEVLKLAMAVDDPESLFKAPAAPPVTTEPAYVAEGEQPQPPTLQAH
jgi:ATP-dependent Lon protease